MWWLYRLNVNPLWAEDNMKYFGNLPGKPILVRVLHRSKIYNSVEKLYRITEIYWEADLPALVDHIVERVVPYLGNVLGGMTSEELTSFELRDMWKIIVANKHSTSNISIIPVILIQIFSSSLSEEAAEAGC